MKSNVHDDVINWKHVFALVVLCEGNPPVIGGFHSQRPVTRNSWAAQTYDIFSNTSLYQILINEIQRAWWRHQLETFFRVSGPLWGKFTGHRWIPLTKASDAELWCFLWSAPEKWFSKQSRRRWFETSSLSLWRHCNASSNMHTQAYGLIAHDKFNDIFFWITHNDSVGLFVFPYSPISI